MKGYTLLTSIFLFLVFSILIAGCSQKVQQEEVLASFDKQVVTLSELDKRISDLPEWKKDKYKDQAGKQEYLNEVAEEKLLSLVAAEKELQKDPEIAKQVSEYRDQLMLKELVKREVDNKVQVTDADLEKYYSENKDKYIEPEKVVVTEITLKDEEKAKEVMDKISNGADFTELAKEMDSKGESFGPGMGRAGKTAAFSRDSFPAAKVFVEKCFSLEPGQMSDIIVQPMDKNTFYMIVRLDEHRPSRQKDFSEVKDEIQRVLEREKKKEKLNQWLEELKKKRKFQIYADRIPKTVEKKAEETEKKAEQAEPISDQAKPANSDAESSTPDVK